MKRRTLIKSVVGCSVFLSGCLGFLSKPFSLSIFNRTDNSRRVSLELTSNKTAESVLSEQFVMEPDTAEYPDFELRSGVAYEFSLEVEDGERLELPISPSTTSVEVEIEQGGTLDYQAAVS